VSKGKQTEMFVPDLGVDVDPNKFYVMADSGAMYGGIENSFDTREAALVWVEQYNSDFTNPFDMIDLDDVDEVIQGKDIIAVYSVAETPDGENYKTNESLFDEDREAGEGWCVVGKNGEPGAGLFNTEQEAKDFARDNGYPADSVKRAYYDGDGSEMKLIDESAAKVSMIDLKALSTKMREKEIFGKPRVEFYCKDDIELKKVTNFLDSKGIPWNWEGRGKGHYVIVDKQYVGEGTARA